MSPASELPCTATKPVAVLHVAQVTTELNAAVPIGLVEQAHARIAVRADVMRVGGDQVARVWSGSAAAAASKTPVCEMCWLLDQFDRAARWRLSTISCSARSITRCGASGMSATSASAAEARMP